jgi:hypothetical protein
MKPPAITIGSLRLARRSNGFHGGNDLGLALYDASERWLQGRLHIDRVNQNQGAESTLAFLLSLAEMRRTQDTMSASASRAWQRYPWLHEASKSDFSRISCL